MLRRLLVRYGVGLHLACPFSNSVMLVLGFPLGFFASGAFSPIGAFFTELFPSRVPRIGPGILLQCGTRHSRTLPHACGYLQQNPALGHAIAIFAVSAYLVMIVAVVALPETRGQESKVYE